ncbi:MAG: hypothetical protein DRN49_00700 [Thaumarchaeota archaeon]|nr:MAG: hypothetical protein DRN49_00700 [Nitrososphaerota archaeon]
MSSLGGLIVLAVLTAVSLAAMGYLMIAMVTHNQLFVERMKFMEKIGERCKGYLKIESIVKFQDNRTIEAVIKNVGAGQIPVKKFDEIDLIVIYRNSNGSIRAEWLPYDPSGDLEKGWSALNITYNGVEELENPATSDMSSGFWDNEESLAIRAWISSDQDIADEFMLIMVTPNGVRTI